MQDNSNACKLRCDCAVPRSSMTWSEMVSDISITAKAVIQNPEIAYKVFLFLPCPGYVDGQAGSLNIKERGHPATSLGIYLSLRSCTLIKIVQWGKGVCSKPAGAKLVPRNTLARQQQQHSCTTSTTQHPHTTANVVGISPQLV